MSYRVTVMCVCAKGHEAMNEEPENKLVPLSEGMGAHFLEKMKAEELRKVIEIMREEPMEAPFTKIVNKSYELMDLNERGEINVTPPKGRVGPGGMVMPPIFTTGDARIGDTCRITIDVPRLRDPLERPTIYEMLEWLGAEAEMMGWKLDETRQYEGTDGMGVVYEVIFKRNTP